MKEAVSIQDNGPKSWSVHFYEKCTHDVNKKLDYSRPLWEQNIIKSWALLLFLGLGVMLFPDELHMGLQSRLYVMKKNSNKGKTQKSVGFSLKTRAK